MAGTLPIYKRLPGTGYRSAIPLVVRGPRVHLWESEDHLLLVDSHSYRETYKRFNYRDIQAVTAYRTLAGRIINVALGFIALPLAAMTLAVGEPIGRGILGTIFLVVAGFLVANVIAGPTCKCFLRTAVQVEEIPSLRRVRVLRKFLERVGPRIAAVQGSMTPEETAARMLRLAGGAVQAVSVTTSEPADSEILPEVPAESPQPESPPVVAEVPETPPTAGS
jgi:hypothetical protein